MNSKAFRDMVYIHADESCLGNQFSDRATPGGAAGLIEVFHERRGWTRRDYYVCEKDTTNQRMALRSASEGLRLLRRPCRVTFFSDSNYLVTGMKQWIHDWARRGWKRKGGAIENLELWLQTIRASRRHEIEWRWVRGHAGNPKNEYVNQLAIKAAREQQSSHGLVDSGFESWLAAQQERDRFLDFFDLPPKPKFAPDTRPPEPP
jgi:ribonuclease HI